ncbi:MAG: MATE family efflux transporter [Lachnospiraceae bacterium]|nr:MATE family efflux transporter [Lachnospiraceae bacterium]MBQ6546065.1 MATE family efflux transporter [Lachnospiraceae bacterium]
MNPKADFPESRKPRGSRHEIDMTNGPLFGKMMLFTFPLMITALLQLIFNAADMIIAGRYSPNGAASISAIGSTLSVINLVIALVTGCSVGTNVVVAEHIGARKPKMVSRSVHTSITFSLLLGTGLGLLGILISRPILVKMGTPAEVLPLALLYIRIYFAGLPVLSLYNFGSGVLRAVGDTRRPMLYLLTAGILNVIMNLFFVVVLHLDVAGVALATTLSQCVSAGLVIGSLVRSEESYHFSVRQMGLDLFTLRKIIHVGIPAGFQTALFSLSNVLIQSSINSFGVTVIAGNSAAQSIGTFVNTASQSTGHAATTFASQNYGARKFDRINRVLVTSLIVTTLLSLLLGVPATIFGRQFLGIYTTDQGAVEAGLVRMLFMCLPHFIGGWMNAACGVMRGIGYEVLPMIVSLVGACLLRIVWIYTVFAAFHTLPVLYASYPVTWGITAAVHLLCFFLLRGRSYAVRSRKA